MGTLELSEKWGRRPYSAFPIDRRRDSSSDTEARRARTRRGRRKRPLPQERARDSDSETKGLFLNLVNKESEDHETSTALMREVLSLSPSTPPQWTKGPRSGRLVVDGCSHLWSVSSSIGGNERDLFPLKAYWWIWKTFLQLNPIRNAPSSDLRSRFQAYSRVFKVERGQDQFHHVYVDDQRIF